MTDDVFYDRGEFLAAAAAPEYATSARYRDEVAAKLQRSRAAGTVSPMGEEVRHEQRHYEVNAWNNDEGLYGAGVPMPGPDPAQAIALNIDIGTFKNVEEVALAFAAPAYEIDRGYQAAVLAKIERSIREGTLDPSVFNSGR